MSMQEANQAIQKRCIHFSNGHQAWSIMTSIGTDIKTILHVLNIQRPRALIMIASGASKMTGEVASHLAQLCSHGIISAAVQKAAMIIDGGTQAGVIELMGQGLTQHSQKLTLLGVTCAGLVAYPGGPAIKEELLAKSAPLDPNHSHFVLLECEVWGGETETMYALARLISKDIPVVTIVVNGGSISKKEVLYSVRQGWPLLVIENSGRIADEIATLWREKPSPIKDEMMREIISSGNISLFPLIGSPEELKLRILHLLGSSDSQGC